MNEVNKSHLWGYPILNNKKRKYFNAWILSRFYTWILCLNLIVEFYI